MVPAPSPWLTRGGIKKVCSPYPLQAAARYLWHCTGQMWSGHFQKWIWEMKISAAPNKPLSEPFQIQLMSSQGRRPCGHPRSKGCWSPQRSGRAAAPSLCWAAQRRKRWGLEGLLNQKVKSGKLLGFQMLPVDWWIKTMKNKRNKRLQNEI